MQNGHVLTFPGTRAGFERAFADFRRTLDGHDLQRRARYQCELVFEEVVTNIIRHGYTDNQEHGIQVSLDFPDELIVLSFEDDGAPFDPREQAAGQPGSVLDSRLGGRGLLLIRKAAQSLTYERTPQARNRLTVTIADRS